VSDIGFGLHIVTSSAGVDSIFHDKHPVTKITNDDGTTTWTVHYTEEKTS
jgi:hypothetical protein